MILVAALLLSSNHYPRLYLLFKGEMWAFLMIFKGFYSIMVEMVQVFVQNWVPCSSKDKQRPYYLNMIDD